MRALADGARGCRMDQVLKVRRHVVGRRPITRRNRGCTGGTTHDGGGHCLFGGGRGGEGPRGRERAWDTCGVVPTSKGSHARMRAYLLSQSMFAMTMTHLSYQKGALLLLGENGLNGNVERSGARLSPFGSLLSAAAHPITRAPCCPCPWQQPWPWGHPWCPWSPWRRGLAPQRRRLAASQAPAPVPVPVRAPPWGWTLAARSPAQERTAPPSRRPPPCCRAARRLHPSPARRPR